MHRLDIASKTCSTSQPKDPDTYHPCSSCLLWITETLTSNRVQHVTKLTLYKKLVRTVARYISKKDGDNEISWKMFKLVSNTYFSLRKLFGHQKSSFSFECIPQVKLCEYFRESVRQQVEASDSESADNSILQVKQEVDQRMIYARQIKDLVTECIRKEGDITCCAIDDGKNCHFYQVQVHYQNFNRHICRVHTEEAKRRGFFTPTIQRFVK